MQEKSADVPVDVGCRRSERESECYDEVSYSGGQKQEEGG
jgi:hypothetical protein